MQTKKKNPEDDGKYFLQITYDNIRVFALFLIKYNVR